MRPSYDPLQMQDRERSKTAAMLQRCAHKGFRHPFFLHSGALAITSPPHKAYFPGVLPNKGAPVFVTSELSAPGEGRSRLGRRNLPRIRSSEITATLHSLRLLQTFVCTQPLCPTSAKDSSMQL